MFLERLALMIATASAIGIAAVVTPGGIVSQPLLGLGLLCVGLASSVVAYAASVRGGRHNWVRRSATAYIAAFGGAALWIVYLLSSTPLS